MTPQLRPTPSAGPVRHTIAIQVEDGRLKYVIGENTDAKQIKVRRGEIVVWQSDHGNYAVLFKSKTPFAEVAYHGHRGMPSNEARVIGVNGSYDYAVTVVPDGAQPITDDPVIIVNDGD